MIHRDRHLVGLQARRAPSIGIRHLLTAMKINVPHHPWRIVVGEDLIGPRLYTMGIEAYPLVPDPCGDLHTEMCLIHHSINIAHHRDDHMLARNNQN
jgi:hypothetical protein